MYGDDDKNSILYSRLPRSVGDRVGSTVLVQLAFSQNRQFRDNCNRCPLPFLLPPLPSNRHHRSNGDCLEGKRENYQVCSVQYCVQQLYTVNCTHVINIPNSSLDWVLSYWAHFTVRRSFLYVLCAYCILHACVGL